MVTKHLCWGYSFMLRLRQISYCLHIRGIDCHTPVYLVHPVYAGVYWVYKGTQYTLVHVHVQDLYLALRNVIL